MNNLEVNDLIRSVNNRVDVIEQLGSQVRDKACDYLNEINLQGAELIKLKNGVEHGQWMHLFEAGRIKIDYKKAQRHMRVAANWAQLSSAGSLRQALQLCESTETESKAETVKRWPAYMEGLGRVSKFIVFIRRNPLEGWPSQGKDKLKAELEPIAKTLWPERFAL